MSVSQMPFLGDDGDAGGGEPPSGGASSSTRLGGDHWWDPDRERHVRDTPRHCPNCGHAVSEDETSLAVEYWEADRRVYRVWCRSCEWSGDVVKVDRVRGHEPEGH